jgi:hypothetical protein
MFGAEAVATGDTVRLSAGKPLVEVAPHAAVAAELGDAAPDPAGRGDHMALVALRVADLAATAALLASRAIPFSEIRGRLRVPASAAMNTTLDFQA